MCFWGVLKLVKVLFLNMCKILESTGFFVCHGGLVKFFSAWGAGEKLLGCGLLRGISTHADTMNYYLR